MNLKKKFSVIVPVFNNSDFIDLLFDRFCRLSDTFDQLSFEFILVDDGSTDDFIAKATKKVKELNLRVLIVSHARNLGSSSAIDSGLLHSIGEYVFVMSADLQEPDSLYISMIKTALKTNDPIIVGVRSSRRDGFLSDFSSKISWRILRRLINQNLPLNGVDIFGCRNDVVKYLNMMQEKNSSLIGRLYWLGYSVTEIAYDRQIRILGRSGWTFRKKCKYLFDSIFSFTNLPIAILQGVGFIGLFFTSVLSIYILYSWQMNQISVSGYVPIMLMIGFVFSINNLGLGIIGSYIWRIFENSKNRPKVLHSLIYSSQHSDEVKD